ncbi:molybdate ABC transporter substrate-binding protein [Paraferrimonas haliotis]|uniref:Molybdate ABC transporter substrate-binding protein n=1 Tax=Paraferrimonas haliotis TaxID=2013866 RepID=A0AA37TUY4_9GAMM|nr:molybdate ABC transporter substrate-binding protein [Paraferrimonas haliotis]GLS84987.1 molybdate ABC transporter substrate-binding protein [Paraferrimonas haliotis]
MAKLAKPLAALALLFSLTTSAHAEKLTIAVAANFKHTMDELVAQFEADTGHQVTVATGSTGGLYTQILHGAPYDLFFAADAERPQLLEQRQLIEPNSRFTYAIGILTLWQPQQEPSLALLTDWSKKVSIANPKTAPYGEAAAQVLTKLGLFQQYQRRLVKGNNIVQAYQYVDSGNVELGFVSLSQLTAAGVREHYYVIPQQYYHPIEQQAVVLKRSNQLALATQFAHFVQQNKATVIAAGYRLPEGN